MHGAHRALVIGPRLVSCVLAVVLAVTVRMPPAHAEERVAVLTRMLASSSDKTRLSAVLALAKLGTRAAQRPLIHALRDPSVRVRAVAATALGSLGSEPALPALHALARDDSDPGVRQAASNAAVKIARFPHHDAEKPAPGRGPGEETLARRGPTTGHPAYASEPHADLYVLINSSSDDSPGTADKETRKRNADIIKRALIERFRTEASVTSVASEAQRWGLDARHIDLSVTRLELSRTDSVVQLDAQLRLALSDDQGRLLSFLTGGAKLEVPVAKFDARYLPEQRREVLENAMRGMFDKLLAHLHDSSQI
jgi:hypothetical protein